MMNETVNTMVANAEEVKRAIVNNMETVVSRYDWEYTRKALNKIYDKFMERKGSLINILSKHPNWNAEKLYIHFDADYTRTFDENEMRDFRYFFVSTLNNLDEDALSEIFKKHRESFPSIYAKTRDYMWFDTKDCVKQFFNLFVDSLECSTVTKRQEELLDEWFPELKSKEGQKLSRLVGKYCRMIGFDKVENYNSKYAKLADSLSPAVYKRHTVLSVNPVDYLMMSNGNTWASCHTIDVQDTEGRDENYSGCYCAGTLSYMLDECSMVFYTVDSKADGNDLELEYKVLRNMFHYQNDKLLQARLYPQCNDSNSSNELKENIRAIVQKIFADCLGIDNLWRMTKKYNNHIDTGYGARQYDDYYHFTCYMSYPKALGSLENTGSEMVIGARPMCIECGDEYCIDDNNTINGCSGRPDNEEYCICESCGARIREEDSYYYNGCYYCEDCVTWSDMEQENIPNSEAVDLIRRYHDDVVTENYAINNRNIGYCDRCNNYFYIPDTEDTGYCYDCEDDMETCDSCGCLILPDEENEHDGYTYCDSCYKEVLREEEEEKVTICNECGCVIEGGVYTHNGKLLCEDCYERIVDEDIESVFLAETIEEMEMEYSLGIFDN